MNTGVVDAVILLLSGLVVGGAPNFELLIIYGAYEARLFVWLIILSMKAVALRALKVFGAFDYKRSYPCIGIYCCAYS